jgi:hypothetical protein
VRRIGVIACALAAALLLPAVAAPQPPRPAVDEVLRLAGEYVGRYERAFSGLVAREDYEQVGCGQSRRLASDVVFVRIPGDVPWIWLRDVFEVDGRPVRDRVQRLVALLSSATPDLAHARAILEEGARFNLGPVQRNFNVPTVALAFLLPANQRRFAFALAAGRQTDAGPVTVLRYRETAHPTLVRNRQTDADVPASGEFWIAADGTVARSEFRVAVDRVDATQEVDYEALAATDVWVPVRMRETFDARVDPFSTGSLATGPRLPRCAGGSGTAAYSEYRRFSVGTDEQYVLPKPPGL